MKRISLLMLATVGAAEALLAWAPTPLASSRAAQMPRPVLMALEKPLDTLDKQVISRAVRLSNHGAALTSLAYFGLVSSTMQMPNAQMPMATLASVITRRVGSTTNAQFSQFFATSITPASYVFFIWPCIAAVQTITLVISYLRPAIENGGPQNSLEALNSVAKGESLSQTELASISLANAAAAAWLFASSNAVPGALPLASVLVLPLVPLLAGYPLRSPTPPSAVYRPVFQIFSSFTAIASCLAVAVELQYGGRVPFLCGRPELCGCIFLSLVGGLISLPRRSLARRAVTTFTLSGVVSRRLAAGSSAGALLLSPTFVGAVALLAWSVKKLTFE